MKVYKYLCPLHELEDEIVFSIPGFVKTLSVQNQRENLCIFVLVSGLSKVTEKIYRVAGTGHPIDPMWADGFIGTVLFSGGDLVFHVFE